ncbi:MULTISPECIES: polysaccharide deacetylase family protein [Allobacillus]|uniref:Polysaccharide deacetylase family protein n=1 Tax=Allobacillus salarius TaxID=1955272 RepID=A0A556PN77_9BACI|nr:polysaccharide deacetylase family protein [Allobacillus salarius]TSJ65831.1 polysaccharide deacetylase family protein [Allobacillus salarius]
MVDVEQERFIEQEEILIDNKENRNKIYRLLLERFQQQEDSYLFEDFLKEWTENEDNQFTNMFFKDQSVVFKFDKYEVTAGAAGSPEISIPFHKMEDIFTDEWKEKIDFDHTEKPEPSKEDESETPKPSKKDDPGKESKEDANSNKKKVALTFDDGPHPTNTLEILELLDKHDAKATFFMLGNRVDFYPDIAKVVAEKGHELGNHTWTHKDLTTLGQEEISEEVAVTNEVIRNATGEEPTVFRPPYGAVDDHVREVLGLPPTFWTIDTLDWKSRDPNQIVKIVEDNVRDGSVILMHDIHETTVTAVERILSSLEKEGYEFVTVSEIESN